MGIKITSVALSGASQSAMTSRSGRSATITNDSSQPVYVLFGSGAASATVFSEQLASKASCEVPGVYAGAVAVFGTAASGSVFVAENV